MRSITETRVYHPFACYEPDDMDEADAKRVHATDGSAAATVFAELRDAAEAAYPAERVIAVRGPDATAWTRYRVTAESCRVYQANEVPA